MVVMLTIMLPLQHGISCSSAKLYILEHSTPYPVEKQATALRILRQAAQLVTAAYKISHLLLLMLLCPAA